MIPQNVRAQTEENILFEWSWRSVVDISPSHNRFAKQYVFVVQLLHIDGRESQTQHSWCLDKPMVLLSTCNLELIAFSGNLDKTCSIVLCLSVTIFVLIYGIMHIYYYYTIQQHFSQAARYVADITAKYCESLLVFVRTGLDWSVWALLTKEAVIVWSKCSGRTRHPN